MLPAIRYLLKRRKAPAVLRFPVGLHGEDLLGSISNAAEERRECDARPSYQVCTHGILNGRWNRQVNGLSLRRALCSAAEMGFRKDESSSSDGRWMFQTVDQANSDHHKIIEICDILSSKPWGTQAQELLETSCGPFNSHIVTKVITTTASDAALNFFNWLPYYGFEHSADTYTAIINSLGAAGRLDSMKSLVEVSRKAGRSIDSACYGRLIHWCVRKGDTAGAMDFFTAMNQDGLTLDVATYTDMFDLRAREGQYEEAVALYLQMVEEGISPNSRTCAVLIHHLLKVGKLDSAYEVFTMLSDLKVKPYMSTYAYLMAAYAKVGNTSMLHKLGVEVKDAYSRPGEIFCSAVESLQREGKESEADAFAEELWPELSVNERRLKVKESGNAGLAREAQDDNQSEDLQQVTACFKEFANNGNEGLTSKSPGKGIQLSLSDLVKLFESDGLSVLDKLKVNWTDDVVYRVLRQISNSDVAWGFFLWLKARPGFRHDVYNEIYMLHTLARGRKVSALRELLIDMQGSRVRLTMNTFNNLIKDFSFARDANSALWVFNQIKEFNLQANQETFRLLVHVLARDSYPEKALELSALMEALGIKLDTETYTAVIHSLGIAGKCDQAWSVYQKMLASNSRPDAYTYTVLLNIMNLAGDNDFAIKLYKEMNDGGIAPTAVAQGIMANTFQKAGNLAEPHKLNMQRKFLDSKKREDCFQHIYEILQENLAEQENSSSLLF